MKDIRIMELWAKLHNKIMISYMNGDKEGTGIALAEAANGSFSYLTNAQTTIIRSNDDENENITP